MAIVIIAMVIGFVALVRIANSETTVDRSHREFVIIRWQLDSGETVEHIYRRSAVTSIVQTSTEDARTQVVVGGHPYKLPVGMQDFKAVWGEVE